MSNRHYTAGIDAGSRAIKIAVIDAETMKPVAHCIDRQGIHQAERASSLYQQLLLAHGITVDQIQSVIATGYGRSQVDFANATVTEITCHGTGVHALHPDARTVVDIGGQDSKLICLDENGAVYDFAMNDRCAAGTGRFLEVVAERLEVPLEQLGELAKEASAPSTISSMCVVFAETEIIGLLAANEAPANIVAGVQASIASRVMAMAGRLVTPPVIFTGGVALVPGMRTALATALDTPVAIATDAQYTGALGAAILAARR